MSDPTVETKLRSSPRTAPPGSLQLRRMQRCGGIGGNCEQQDVIVAAQRYFDLANVRYRTGIDTFLNFFTAQTTLLTNQQTAVNLRVQQITSSVQLIEALGGGWDMTQLPTEKAVAVFYVVSEGVRRTTRGAPG